MFICVNDHCDGCIVSHFVVSVAKTEVFVVVGASILAVSSFETTKTDLLHHVHGCLAQKD